MTDAQNGPRYLPMTPTKIFGSIMSATNGDSYRAALHYLSLPEHGALLEIGFGAGKLLEMVKQDWGHASLAGVDPTPDMLSLASSRKALRTVGGQVDLRLGGAEALPWKDGSFDCAVSVNSFQFWNPPQLAVSEVLRVLKQGGQLVLVLRDHTSHAPAWLPNPISRGGNEIEDCKSLLAQSGFGAVEVHVIKRAIVVITGQKDRRS
jgi:ubiquinone/menaquinone biosynthesis C-methylase UbiE